MLLIKFLSITLFEQCLNKPKSNVSQTPIQTLDDNETPVHTSLQKTPIQSMTFKKISDKKFTCYLTFFNPINHETVQLMYKGGGDKETDFISKLTLDSEIKSVHQGKGMEIKLDFNQIADRGVFAIYIYLAEKNNLYFCTEPFVYNEDMAQPELERAYKKGVPTWIFVMIIVLSALVGIILIAFIIRCFMYRTTE